MDVFKAIRELHDEKVRLDSAILALEARMRHVENANRFPGVRRGRRSMSAREREEVSRRMSSYWAARRAQRQGTISVSVSSGSVGSFTSIQIQDVA